MEITNEMDEMLQRCLCVRVRVHCIICVLAFKQGIFCYEKEQNTAVNTTKARNAGGDITTE